MQLAVPHYGIIFRNHFMIILLCGVVNNDTGAAIGILFSENLHSILRVRAKEENEYSTRNLSRDYVFLSQGY